MHLRRGPYRAVAVSGYRRLNKRLEGYLWRVPTGSRADGGERPPKVTKEHTGGMGLPVRTSVIMRAQSGAGFKWQPVNGG